MKKSDIIADALGELDENTLTPPEPEQKEKTEHIFPKMIALAAAVLILIIAIPIIRPFLLKDPGKTNPAADDGELVYNYFRCVGEAPFKLPDFAYKDGYSVYQAYYANNFGLENFAPYVSSLEESGFTTLHQSETGAYLLRRDCIIQLWYAKETNRIIINWISKSAYAPDNALSEEDAAKLIYSKPRLQVGRLCPIDVTPKGFYEASGAQMFAVPYCSSDDLNPFTSYMEQFGSYSWRVFCIRDGVIGCTDLEKAAVADIDGDGENDVFLMNNGGTSGVLTVCVDVITKDKTYSAGSMMYEKFGFKNDNGKVIVRTVSEKFGELLFDLTISDGGLLLCKRGSELPPVSDKRLKWIFTDKGQPKSSAEWNFPTDNGIDGDARRYFPTNYEQIKGKISAHNAAYFSVEYLDEYVEKLKDMGLTMLQVGDERLFYDGDAILTVRRRNDPETGAYNVFFVNVFINKPLERDGALSQSEALDIINNNCLTETLRVYRDGEYKTEEKIHDPLPCAVDVTPAGFYDLTGMQIFVCPWTWANSYYKFPFSVAFFVNKNGAVITNLGAENKDNGRYFDLNKCLSTDGYYGGPVICDIDGDGENEMIVITPCASSYSGNAVDITVYEMKKPSVSAFTEKIYFKSENIKLMYSSDKTAILHAYSDDKKIDAYIELGAENGAVIMKDFAGNKIDLNLPPDAQIVNYQLERTDIFETVDGDDKFTDGALISPKTSLTNDEMIDREIIEFIRIFDINGKLWLINGEDYKDVKIIEEINGEYVRTGGYRFRYNSFEMVYYINDSNGADLYALNRRNAILRYDLENGDVYSFIQTKDPIVNIHYNDGVVYYMTLNDKTYTLKAAVISERVIYRLCTIDTGKGLTAYYADEGVYVVINDEIYYMGYGGRVTKIYSPENDAYIRQYGTYGKDLYCIEIRSKQLLIISPDGSVKKSNINVSNTTVKSDFPGASSISATLYGPLTVYNGAVVSRVTEDNGEHGLYLYYPDENRWEDITPAIPGGMRDFSVTVTSDAIFTFCKTETKTYMSVYKNGKTTVQETKDFVNS